jgi:hypothetical protein
VTRRTPLLVLAATLAVAGCRSDGGIDRADTVKGMSFACESVLSRTEQDARTTRDTLARLPGSVSESFRDSGRTMAETYHLYLDSHETH